MIAEFPKGSGVDRETLELYDRLKDITTSVRDIKNKNQIKPSEEVKLLAAASDITNKLVGDELFHSSLLKMANLSEFELSENKPDNAVSFISGKDSFSVIIEKEIDVEEEIVKVSEELDYAKGFVTSVNKKLSNENFVNNAPGAVVDRERNKLSDGEERVRLLEERLAGLKRQL